MKRLFVCVSVTALIAGCQQPAETTANTTAVSNTATAAPAATVLAAPPTKEAALKLMHDRHENMEDIGKAVKATGRTLKSTAPDLAVVRASAATIAKFAPDVPSWFPPGTGPDVGKTQAKAEIWQKPEDYAAKMKTFQEAAAAFDVAAKAGDMATIGARFGDLGKSCKACHETYRSEHKK